MTQRLVAVALLSLLALTACGDDVARTAPTPTSTGLPNCGAPCYPAHFQTLLAKISATPTQ